MSLREVLQVLKLRLYQPQEYKAKLLFTSNVASPKWGTGSLCDFSYWSRGGNPQDFKEEIYEAFGNFDKVTPASHTYIGGAKKDGMRCM